MAEDATTTEEVLVAKEVLAEEVLVEDQADSVRNVKEVADLVQNAKADLDQKDQVDHRKVVSDVEVLLQKEKAFQTVPHELKVQTERQDVQKVLAMRQDLEELEKARASPLAPLQKSGESRKMKINSFS